MDEKNKDKKVVVTTLIASGPDPGEQLKDYLQETKEKKPKWTLKDVIFRNESDPKQRGKIVFIEIHFWTND